MRVDNSAASTIANQAPADGSALTPYNTPTASDFQSVMRNMAPSTTTTTLPTDSTGLGQSATGSATSTTGIPTGTTTSSGLPAPTGTTSNSAGLPTATGASQGGTASSAGGTATTSASTQLTGIPTPSTGVSQSGLPFLSSTGSQGEGTMLSILSSMSQAMAAMAQAMTALEQAGGGSANSAALQSAQQAYNSALSSTGAMKALLSPSTAGASTAITFSAPLKGALTVTQPFGPSTQTMEPSYAGYDHFHTGIDYAVPTGTEVDAAGAGTVVEAGWDNTGFGNHVVIDHGNGIKTLYGHLSEVDVKVGQTVSAGQQIGLSGSTGNSTGPHLHFGVQQYGQWVDPTPYLSGQAGSTASATQSRAVSGGIDLPPVSPTGSSDLQTMIGQVATQVGISPALLRAVVQTESGGDPNAVSPVGAKGLTQLMDSTAKSYGVDNPFDPLQNLTGGARYLRDLLTRYHGDTRLAVAAYNAGPGAVDRYGDVPPYNETQNYVHRVLSLASQSGS